MKNFGLLLLFAFLFVKNSISQPLSRPIRHVVLIGVDGMSPNGIKKSFTPVMNGLMMRGAYTFHARAVTPSTSSPNWASIISGADVEQHGVPNNDYEPDAVILPPVVRGTAEIFPTVFGEINALQPGAEIGAIYQWSGFGRLFEKKAVDFDINPKDEYATAREAARYIVAKKPVFCFIHFDHVDHAGHEYGHGTARYYKAVETADSLIGQVLEAIKEAGIADETLVIIGADHGGIGNGHGGMTLEEMEVPFILSGPGVKANYQIPVPVYQYDHAATVMFALGLEAPYAWIGRPVRCAFEGFSEPARSYPLFILEEAPVFSHPAQGYKPAGGLFSEPVKVAIQHDMEGELRYTLDGSTPSATAPLYRDPIVIGQNCVLQAAVFRGEQQLTHIGRAFYRFYPGGQPLPVKYRCYTGENWQKLPDFSRLKMVNGGSCMEFTTEGVVLPRQDQTGVVFESKLRIETEGEYVFYTRSDDGSRLYINDKLVVDNDGDHGVLEARGKVRLSPGEHPVRVEWFNGGGGLWLDVFWQAPGKTRQILSAADLRP